MPRSPIPSSGATPSADRCQEARQWELPVVLRLRPAGRRFPARLATDPLLGEALRSALRRHGIAVRTRSERDAEERFLFDVALTRATVELVLSYPRLNDDGEPTLGAFALDRIPGLLTRRRWRVTWRRTAPARRRHHKITVISP